jgi:hypothetical protein
MHKHRTHASLSSLPCVQGRVGVGCSSISRRGQLEEHPLPTSPCKQGEGQDARGFA